jgi:hypothetical protein
MRNTKLAFALIVLSSVPADAAPKHWYTDKLWWAGEAINIAMPLLDANSTEYGIHRGGIETHPWLIGHHPTPGQAYGAGVGAAVLYTGLHIATWKLSHDDSSKAWRNVGRWGVPATVTANHLPAAIHNYRIEHPSYRGN